MDLGIVGRVVVFGSWFRGVVVFVGKNNRGGSCGKLVECLGWCKVWVERCLEKWI